MAADRLARVRGPLRRLVRGLLAAALLALGGILALTAQAPFWPGAT